MKKAILLTLCGAFLFTTKSEAQVFVTSFGVTQSWGLPADVYYSVDHNYYGYDWVHAQRIVDHGAVSFDVVLQRGDVFVSLNLDAFGHIRRRVVNYEYPLYQHVCSDFCGYHTNYYSNHVTVCNSHYHQGHNHVVYVTKTHEPHGNAYGYYKSKDNHHQDNHYENKSNSQPSRSSSQPSRVVYNDRPTSVTYKSESGSGRSRKSSTSSSASGRNKVTSSSDSRSRTSTNVSSTNQSRSRYASSSTYSSRRD